MKLFFEKQFQVRRLSKNCPKRLSKEIPQNPFRVILDLTPSVAARRFRQRWAQINILSHSLSPAAATHRRKELIYRAVARQIPVYVC